MTSIAGSLGSVSLLTKKLQSLEGKERAGQVRNLLSRGQQMTAAQWLSALPADIIRETFSRLAKTQVLALCPEVMRRVDRNEQAVAEFARVLRGLDFTTAAKVLHEFLGQEEDVRRFFREEGLDKNPPAGFANQVVHKMINSMDPECFMHARNILTALAAEINWPLLP